MSSIPYLESREARAGGRRTAVPQRPPKVMIGAEWLQHRDLLRNAGSLVAATGVTSVLGAAYWTFAARLFSQQEVGYGAAEVPAMTLLGTIGMFGLGTLLIGELPRRKRRAELVSAALIACAIGSLALGVGFVLIAPRLSKRFAVMIGSPDQKGLFVLGVTLTGVSLVFDLATIGLLRGGIQLARNITFSFIKLATLPVFAFTLHDRLGIGIPLSWVAGIALSLFMVAVRLAISGTQLLARPDWTLLRSLGRTTMSHNWLNIAIAVPPTVLPVLVTVLVSPSANAAFYVAFTLSSFLYVVPGHLATVLFALAAAEPDAIARKVRFASRLSYITGLPAMAILILAGHWMLSIYGPGYARIATVPMYLLALGYIPSVPKALYIAVCRAKGHIAYAAAILTMFTIMEVVGAAVGGAVDGLIGLSLALLVVLVIQGIAITPPILRAVIIRGRHRRIGTATGGVGASTVESIPWAPEADHSSADVGSSHYAALGRRSVVTSYSASGRPASYRRDLSFPRAAWKESSKEQQEAGINALIAIAKDVASTVPMCIVPSAYLNGAWLPHGDVQRTGSRSVEYSEKTINKSRVRERSRSGPVKNNQQEKNAEFIGAPYDRNPNRVGRAWIPPITRRMGDT
jgi:O-antigen/teichoic acid export membrane protein